MPEFISVDLGTTLIKCTLFDEAGHTLASESMSCHPSYLGSGMVEQDAEVWYSGVCEAIFRLNTHRLQKEVGICISSQGISVVPVDEAMSPLAPAISWLDTRASAEAETLLSIMPEAAWFHTTGKFLAPSYTLPKILWLRSHRPDIYRQARWFLLPMDYLNARMTGLAVTDHTMAAGTLCYDVASGSWSQEILSAVSLPQERLPEIRQAGALVGTINRETCQRTGLPLGTPVFNGGQDQKVAAYAAGIYASCGSLSLGTAGAMEIFVQDATRQTHLPFCPYILPNQIVVEGCINTTGAAIQWIKDNLFSDMDFHQLNTLAQDSPPGANGLQFYPHLAKPGTPHRSLDIYGFLSGISLCSGRGDLIRSLYEGLAYEIQLNLDAAKLAGSDLKELVVFGGASKSDVFCQIIADVTEFTIHAAENGELCSIGAAKLAAKGMGLDAEVFGRNASGAERVFLPQPAAVEIYRQLYDQYIHIYKK